MKIIILAMDGLEYELVVSWKLRNLMQTKFGEHLSYKSPRFNKVHTPSLWASFITGKSLEEHGIDEWWSWNSFFDWIRKKPPLIWIKNKRKILEKLGVKPKPALKNKADRPETIFDVIKPSIGIDVPTWSLDTEARDWIGKALSISVEEFIKRAWFHHEEKKAKLMEALDQNYRLIMCWFDLPDLIGHIWRRLEMLKCYLEMDHLVSEVKSRLNREDLLLIVSDHGMKQMIDGTGDHTDYGFWSINMEIPWFNPKSITDFYSLILCLVGENP